MHLDGVAELHADLFRRLDCSNHKDQRAKANLRVLRGWSVNADSREGAILKGWVESRFGLLPRFHGEPLRDFSSPAYMRYQEMRSSGPYGTNALEGQLDLLYATVNKSSGAPHKTPSIPEASRSIAASTMSAKTRPWPVTKKNRSFSSTTWFSSPPRVSVLANL